MQKLVEGIHLFQNDVFSSKQRLLEGLVDGHHPLALFVTGSDSRINPSLLTQTKTGRTVHSASCRPSRKHRHEWRK